MLQLVGRRAFGAVAVAFCLAVVLFIYVVDTYFRDIGLARQLSFVLSASTILNVVLALAFNYGWRWLWRWIPALNDLLFPDWNGTWDVEIHWQWEGKQGTVAAEAEIKQSLLKLSIGLQSERSDSETLSVVPRKHSESARPHLHYLYDAKPTAGYQDDNPAHTGAAILKPDLASNDILRGNYFTDRASSGYYIMTRRHNSL